ncbi:MAG: pantetheine-phosphate adenylyltransferase [Hyphomicrobium aestuarii]|nr:pantetheine-phosphate adenylyltransferase [Hyphomicrobium aestuarii]
MAAPANTLRTGFYSGSFDPVTLGHSDVIARSARLVDRLIIGIGVNPGKAPLFSVPERIAMLEAETAAIAKATGTVIEIGEFAGLAIDAARAAGAIVIFRGLRDGTDFDYEMQMAGMNGEMEPAIETVFVAASPRVRHIAANLVRAVATMGGDPSPFVSKAVAQKLKGRSVRGR